MVKIIGTYVSNMAILSFHYVINSFVCVGTYIAQHKVASSKAAVFELWLRVAKATGNLFQMLIMAVPLWHHTCILAFDKTKSKQ